MGHRILGSLGLAMLLLACASKPIDVACKDEITYLESLIKRASLGALVESRIQTAIEEAKVLEQNGEYQACKERAGEARNELYQARQGSILS
jgi:hypothetical protein